MTDTKHISQKEELKKKFLKVYFEAVNSEDSMLLFELFYSEISERDKRLDGLIQAADKVMDLMKLPFDESEVESFHEALEEYNDFRNP